MGAESGVESAETGHTIFDPSESSLLYVTAVLVSLIVFTLAFENAIHQLEHYLHKKNVVYVKMLQKVFKELMILGFISFTLLIVLETSQLTTTAKITFEVAHILVFLLAMFFVLHAILYMSITGLAKRQWDKTASIHATKLLKQWEEEDDGHSRDTCCRSLRRRLFGDTKLVRDSKFHIFKDLFLKKNQLPDNFAFNEYLRGSVNSRITQQLEPGLLDWFILAMVLGFNLVRHVISASLHGDDIETHINYLSDLVFEVAFRWLIFIVSWMLVIIVRTESIRLLREKRVRVEEDIPDVLRNTLEVIHREEKAHNFDTSAVVVEENSRSSQSSRSRGSRLPSGSTSSKTQAVSLSISQKKKVLTERDSSPGLDKTDEKKERRHRTVTMSCVRASEVVMLLQCFFMGSLVTQVLQLAKQYFDGYNLPCFIFIILCATPQLLVMLWLTPRFAQESVFLEAVVKVNMDQLQKTYHKMEEIHKLQVDLSLKLQRQMRKKKLDIDDPAALEVIFKKLDKDGNGFLSQSELSYTLTHKFNLRVSARHLGMVFRVLDTDQSGGIDMEEFIRVVHFNEPVFLWGARGEKRNVHMNKLLKKQRDEQEALRKQHLAEKQQLKKRFIRSDFRATNSIQQGLREKTKSMIAEGRVKSLLPQDHTSASGGLKKWMQDKLHVHKEVETSGDESSSEADDLNNNDGDIEWKRRFDEGDEGDENDDVADDGGEIGRSDDADDGLPEAAEVVTDAAEVVADAAEVVTDAAEVVTGAAEVVTVHADDAADGDGDDGGDGEGDGRASEALEVVIVQEDGDDRKDDGF